MPPRTTPSTRLSATLTRPIVIDVRVAYMSRDQRSRPCVSVPSRNSDSLGLGAFDGNQVAVGRDEAQQLIRLAVAEERDRYLRCSYPERRPA